jgi:predicted unusual protein kinase regulating ubiquinone biosynthesis (AarF/ABC1/UbiB family)
MIRCTQISTSFLYNYLTAPSQDKDGKQLDEKCKKLRCLTATLQNYGGVLSKLSQMLSLDNQDSSVFSDCTPFSRKKTIKYLEKSIGDLISLADMGDMVLSDIDINVYKSGSIGQVHRATLDGLPIILKVQYSGLLEQTSNDLALLDRVINYMYDFSDLKDALGDIHTRVNEELDYDRESSNQTLIYDIYKNDPEIIIPKVFDCITTDRIIAMEELTGQSLRDFMTNAPTEEKNNLGKLIARFTYNTLFTYGILYSDQHWGNFLVGKNGKTLEVLDFGCLTIFDDQTTYHMREVYRNMLDDDRVSFEVTLTSMGILNDDVSGPSKDYCWKYFKLQHEPWLSDSFTFTDEWLDKATEKNPDLMKEWILPPGLVHLNKLVYSGYILYTKLGLSGNLRSIFDDIFNEL